MLRVDHLSKTYGEGDDAVEAIGDLDFEVRTRASSSASSARPDAARPRCSSACRGCSRRPAAQVLLHDEPVDGPPERMALVFQEYSRSLFPWMTRAPQRGVPAAPKKLDKAEARAARRAGRGLGRPHRLPRPLPVGAVRGDAAACGDRARARLPARDPADGRAVRLGGRADARATSRTCSSRVRERYGVTVVFVTHDIDESVYLGDRDRGAHALRPRACRRRSRWTCRSRAIRSRRRSFRSSRACARTCIGRSSAERPSPRRPPPLLDPEHLEAAGAVVREAPRVSRASTW